MKYITNKEQNHNMNITKHKERLNKWVFSCDFKEATLGPKALSTQWVDGHQRNVVSEWVCRHGQVWICREAPSHGEIYKQGEGGYFKTNVVFKWEPVQLLKGGTKEKGITVILSEWNKGMDQSLSSQKERGIVWRCSSDRKRLFSSCFWCGCQNSGGV